MEELLLCFICRAKPQPLSLQHIENKEQSNTAFTKLREMTQLLRLGRNSGPSVIAPEVKENLTAILEAAAWPGQQD